MASCLGIYIDSNIIKYAKITKEKDDLKVDAFGIKIYSDLLQTIDQIVSETFSFKDQISVNITDEMYDYFYMSDLLSKKDLAKAIETEFESLCVEKQYNPNALESRYAIVNDQNDKTKIKVIHVAENKMKINQILQNFDGKRLQNITPIALTIPNIAQTNEKENALIVNIEDKTSITTLVGSKIYDVQNLDVGAQQILDEINAKENSYLKAYEICKNTIQLVKKYILNKSLIPGTAILSNAFLTFEIIFLSQSSFKFSSLKIVPVLLKFEKINFLNS